MITLFSSTSYTTEDYRYITAVLDSGLTETLCAGETECQSCAHKAACADITRFYRYVCNKALTCADRRGKRQAD